MLKLKLEKIKIRKEMFAALDILIRKFKLLIKRKINRVRRKIERKTGYKYEQYLDALSLSSFGLILYKFLYRVINVFNPFWYYNLLILFISFFIFLFFMEEFRKFIKEYVFKPGLSQLFYECGAADIEPQKYFDYFTIKENLFRKFFFFLIFIRLIILCEPFLFLFFNLFLTYFLIFNKYLLTSSIISIILAISRFTILLEDKRVAQLYKTLNLIDEIPSGYSLLPNYKNTIIVGIWVTRYLMYPEVFNNKESEKLAEISIIIGQLPNLLFYYKLIKANDNIIYWNKTIHLFDGSLFERNKIFFFLLTVFFLCIFSQGDDATLMFINWFVSNKDLFSFYGVINKAFRNHPTFYHYAENYGFLFRTNETTVKKYYPFQYVIKHKHDSIHGILRRGEAIKIREPIYEKIDPGLRKNTLENTQIIFIDVKLKLTNNEKTFMNLLNSSGIRSLIPSSSRIAFSVFSSHLPPTIRLASYEATLNYFESVLKTKDLTFQEKEEHIMVIKIMKKAHYDIKQRLEKENYNLPFSSADKAFFQEEIETLKQLTLQNNTGLISYIDNLVTYDFSLITFYIEMHSNSREDLSKTTAKSKDLINKLNEIRWQKNNTKKKVEEQYHDTAIKKLALNAEIKEKVDKFEG